MRIYSNFRQSMNELKRDVAELGTLVHPQTMQDKEVAGDPDYLTREYRNMIYTVTEPRLEDLDPVQPWADAEFAERLAGTPPDRGRAWSLRPDIWEEFHDRGFGYSYGERYEISLDSIIEELKVHPDSRQLYLAVWAPERDSSRLGKTRVPCSLGYWLNKRDGALSLTYLQRSADLVTHFGNDIYLSHRLQRYLAEQVDCGVGSFTHWIGSLHVYAKDVAGVF